MSTESHGSRRLVGRDSFQMDSDLTHGMFVPRAYQTAEIDSVKDEQDAMANNYLSRFSIQNE